MKSFLLILALFFTTCALAKGATADFPVGKQVTFSVTIATGTPPFTYQWQKNGVPIPGATGATHVIAAIAASDAGTYTVVVTNKAGPATSDNGVLTITVNPGGATVSITSP